MSEDDAPSAAEQSIPSSVDPDASPNQADLDRSEAFVLTLRAPGDPGRGQRLTIEPGSDDPRADWTLDEAILCNGEEWKLTGSEPIKSVAVENVGTVAPSQGALRGHLETAFARAVEPGVREELREALQLLDAVETGL